MKTIQTTKSNPTATPAGQRPTGLRASTARTLEHRYERRKIREQLRRLDWTLNTEE